MLVLNIEFHFAYLLQSIRKTVQGVLNSIKNYFFKVPLMRSVFPSQNTIILSNLRSVYLFPQQAFMLLHILFRVAARKPVIHI